MNKNNFKDVSIEEFIEAVQKLPENEHREEWLRWLKGYDTPGPFDREPDKGHNARYVYNHLAYPEMLLWLIEAAGIDKHLVEAAAADSISVKSKNAKTGAIRKRVPWEVVERALWRPA